jgi:histone acetyltransferase MYST1
MPSATIQAGISQPSPSAPSTPEREHATMTRVRNFEDVRFGEYLIKTWYYSPYPNPAILDERADERGASPIPRSKQVQGNKRRKLDDGVTGTPGHISNGAKRSPERNGHAVKDPSGGRHRYSKNGIVHEGVNGHTTTGVEAIRGRLWVCDVSAFLLRCMARAKAKN